MGRKFAYLVLDKKWFEKHQNKLLFLINNRFTKYLARKVIDIDYKGEIESINPSGFIRKKENEKVLRTHSKDVYGYAIYKAIKPVLWFLHFIDWLILDRYEPIPSFGYDVLTSYSDASPETDTVDGRVRNTSGATWNDIVTAASGTFANHTTTAGTLSYNGSPDSLWLERRPCTYDTSSLGSGASISAAKLVLYVNNKIGTDTSANSTLHVVSCSLANDNDVVTGDWDGFGSTSFGSVAESVWSGYGLMDFDLDSNGIDNISLTGISGFGYRIGFDLNNTEPSGTNGIQYTNVESATPSWRPYLEVTYTPGSSFVPKITMA